MAINPPVILTQQYNTVIIQDLNYNYGYNKKPIVLTNSDALLSQFENLISTRPGERDFEPDFGTLLAQMVFNGQEPSAPIIILNDIKIKTDKFIPDIRMNLSASGISANAILGLYLFDASLYLKGIPIIKRYALSNGGRNG